MIYEARTATIVPGMDEEFVSRVREEYFPMVEKHGGKVIGLFQTVIGHGNQFYYILGFESLGHRDEVFKSMRDDEEYHAIAARWTTEPTLVDLHSIIVKEPSTPFVRSTAGAP